LEAWIQQVGFQFLPLALAFILQGKSHLAATKTFNAKT
jgi:hypothetical protein